MPESKKAVAIKRYERYIAKAQASLDRNKKKLAALKAAK